MKFHVGDIIRPNKIADKKYAFTNSRLVRLMRVIDVCEDYFTAEVVETTKKNKDLQDRKFTWLDFEAFDVVPNVAEYSRSDTDHEYSRPHSIHITWDGESNTVHGIFKVGSTIKARSCAFCHPEDVFEFSTGALIALGRLLGISLVESEEDESHEEEEKPLFQDGDKVTLKDPLDFEPCLDQSWFYENDVAHYMVVYAYGNTSPDRDAVYFISRIVKDKYGHEYAIIKENNKAYAPVFVVATSSLLSVEE